MKRTYPLVGALFGVLLFVQPFNVHLPLVGTPGDRKSTRLNSSH